MSLASLIRLVGGSLILIGATTSVAAPATADAVVWDRAAVEHLFRRAGFGVTHDQMDHYVKLGRDATVESLLATREGPTPRYVHKRATSRHNVPLPLPGRIDPLVRATQVTRANERFSNAMDDYELWWVDRMLSGEDPLLERMTLFWHGIIPSSKYTVRDSLEMIDQHQLVREHALGSLGDLLRGMSRDAAMLRYLDNESNVKGHPNENWARELMELFSLGEGNYTEKDIQEAARAYTGWTKELNQFSFSEIQHDFGMKSSLGVTGILDGDHIVDAILEQPACGRYIARRVLHFMEGVQPSSDRLNEYATYLASNGYEMKPLLRKLFTDDRFYRDEVRASRIAGPVDFLIGFCRQLEITDANQAIIASGVVLGQAIFAPPNVKGWDGDMSWINTATMIQRGNLAGVLLGRVDVESLLHDEELMKALQSEGVAIEESKSRIALSGYEAILSLQKEGWKPTLNLTEHLKGRGKADAEIVSAMMSDLLPIADAAIAPRLTQMLASTREAKGIADGKLLEHPQDAEPVLRAVAHLILSLPEAQLN